jgi:hypothetical protein
MIGDTRGEINWYHRNRTPQANGKMGVTIGGKEYESYSGVPEKEIEGDTERKQKA